MLHFRQITIGKRGQRRNKTLVGLLYIMYAVVILQMESALSWFKISFNLDVTVRTLRHVIFFHMPLILVQWIFQEGLVLTLANITTNAFLNKLFEKNITLWIPLTTHDQRRSRFKCVNPAIFYLLWSKTLGLGSVGELNCNKGFPGAKEWFNSLVGNISVVTDLLLPCLIEPYLTTSARKLYKRKFLESLHVYPFHCALPFL